MAVVSRFFIFLPVLFLFSCGDSGKDEKNNPKSDALGCSASTSQSMLATHSDVASKRFLVQLKSSGKLRARATEIASAARNSLASLGTATTVSPGVMLLETADTMSTSHVAQKIDSQLYEFIEPDYQVHSTFVSNDTDLNKQWAHDIVHSAEAWDISRGSASVVVAVLDSGIQLDHPDLVDNLWTNSGEIAGNGLDDDGDGYVDDVNGWNFVANTNSPIADDSHFHGTHVAGTVGATGNNGMGISGHAQVVKLMPLKFLGSDGSGYTSDAIKGIDFAIAHGAKIINNSWGSVSRSQSLSNAIARAEAAGILFVAAAGNSGLNNDRFGFYPANYPQSNVISVAASTSSDLLASFTNYGAKLVHIAAPGYQIYSTKNGNSYQFMNGTSMATPLISGVLATMIAARPDLSPQQIKGALLSSVDVVDAMKDKLLWNGRVNAFNALSLVMAVDSSWVPPSAPSHTCP